VENLSSGKTFGATQPSLELLRKRAGNRLECSAAAVLVIEPGVRTSSVDGQMAVSELQGGRVVLLTCELEVDGDWWSCASDAYFLAVLTG
jgi:hypothetical protein